MQPSWTKIQEEILRNNKEYVELYVRELKRRNLFPTDLHSSHYNRIKDEPVELFKISQVPKHYHTSEFIQGSIIERVIPAGNDCILIYCDDAVYSVFSEPEASFRNDAYFYDLDLEDASKLHGAMILGMRQKEWTSIHENDCDDEILDGCFHSLITTKGEWDFEMRLEGSCYYGGWVYVVKTIRR